MSGVKPTDPIVLHQYENGRTFCGGKWYLTGESPCETMKAQRDEDMRTLPPCEAEDDRAAALILGVPQISRCWTRDKMSGEPDPILQPERVQAGLISIAAARAILDA